MEVREYLPSFGAESFVFQFAVQNIKDKGELRSSGLLRSE